MSTAPLLPLAHQHSRTEATASRVWLAGRSAMLIALYYAVALWGFVFTPDAYGIPLVWPATGVGLAFVYLYGYRLLPALGIAVSLVTWQFTSAMMPLVEALGIIAATIAGVALGAHGLRRFGFSPGFERLRDVWLLLAIGGLAASGAAAAAGAWGMAASMETLRFSDTWWLCWMSDLMGLMLVAPVLLTWLGAGLTRHAEQSHAKAAALGLSLVAVAALVYAGDLPSGIAMPMSYAVFPLVMLAAVRCPVQVTMALTMIAGAIALSGTGWGMGPFAELGLDVSLLSLNAQLALLVLTALVLSALRGEREAAEARARQHLDELARAGRLSTLGELSAGLAHELNQPLCALTSYAQASKRLLDRGRLEELKEALGQLNASAHRAAETVRQMRAFAAGHAPEFACIALPDLLKPVIDLLGPELRRNHVQMEVSLPDPPPRIRVSPVQIEQVLVNLLRNAMEATEGRSDGQIRLCVRRDGTQLRFSVTDNGPGIPEHRLPSLFDPFATWKSGGLGLGLSISRSLVEAHGGHMIARNREQGGAEFQFTLPMEDHHART
jgi:signal transduction histidine kinase